MSEQRLPMIEPQGGPGSQPPVEAEPSALRLIGTLAVAGALAGLAIVLVFQWAQPRIEAYQARVLAQAIAEVLGGPDHYETIFLEDGRLTRDPQADTAGLDRVYVGFDADENPLGVAMVWEEAGFQDIIRLIFGYDPETDQVLGMKVLESKETPGLGDKITKDSAFISEFSGVGTPLIGVKAGREKGLDQEVTMITGATISSRAVIKIINDRLEMMKEPVQAFWSAPGSVAAVNDGAAQDAAVAVGAGSATPGGGGS
ncbi:MAG: FMN-binding protein [Gemmatimonadota bacterium]